MLACIASVHAPKCLVCFETVVGGGEGVVVAVAPIYWNLSDGIDFEKDGAIDLWSCLAP